MKQSAIVKVQESRKHKKENKGVSVIKLDMLKVISWDNENHLSTHLSNSEALQKNTIVPSSSLCYKQLHVKSNTIPVYTKLDMFYFS